MKLIVDVSKSDYEVIINHCDNRSSYWFGEYVDAKDGCDDWVVER